MSNFISQKELDDFHESETHRENFKDMVTNYKDVNRWNDNGTIKVIITPITNEEVSSADSKMSFIANTEEKKLAMWNVLVLRKLNSVLNVLQVSKNMPNALKARAKKAKNFFLELLDIKNIEWEKPTEEIPFKHYKFKGTVGTMEHTNSILAGHSRKGHEMFWKEIVKKNLDVLSMERINQWTNEIKGENDKEDEIKNKKIEEKRAKKAAKNKRQKQRQKARKKTAKLEQEGREQIEKARKQLLDLEIKKKEEALIKEKRAFRAMKKKERKKREDEEAIQRMLANEETGWDESGKLSPEEAAIFKGGTRKTRRKRKKKTKRRKIRRCKTKRRRRKTRK